MDAKERRKFIVNTLMSEDVPVPGGSLSKLANVSRQIVVSDIALLRAEGYDIISTHQGYVLKLSEKQERVFKLRHTSAQTEDELTSIVELGGTVVDVFVWHKVYGKVLVKLNIFSKYGVEQFMEGIKSGSSSELMHITDGYHYHTVRAESEEALDKIEEMLNKKNYIVPEIE